MRLLTPYLKSIIIRLYTILISLRICVMGDIIFLLLAANLFIFSCIFWALSFLGSYVTKVKEQPSKKQFYECGFKSLSDVNIVFNLNFSLICVFLILYDIEFTLLFPIVFSSGFFNFYHFAIALIFILLVLLSLVYDIQFNALSWQI